MSYRDELEAAHARIEALMRELASTQPLRENDAARGLGVELRIAQQQLAAERELRAIDRSALEAQLALQRDLAAAQAAQAAAVLDATKRALELRLEAVARERAQAEEALGELASLSRGAALRLYQERLAAVSAERARLVAEGAAALGPRPADDAPMDEHIRFATAQRVVELHQKTDQQLAEREARLTRLVAILEQAPRE